MRFSLVCANRRCSTLLPGDAEICDECGGPELSSLPAGQALLAGEVNDRAVGFLLDAGRENVIGREGTEVDLSPLPGSDSVHHVHAAVSKADAGWSITHRGRNPVVIQRDGGSIVVEPGSTTDLQAGDGLVVGLVRLQLLVSSG